MEKINMNFQYEYGSRLSPDGTFMM